MHIMEHELNVGEQRVEMRMQNQQKALPIISDNFAHNSQGRIVTMPSTHQT
jgi:hypothetical protein